MTITFGPLSSSAGTGEGSAALRLVPFGFGDGVLTGGGLALTPLALAAYGFGYGGSLDGGEPAIPATGSSTLTLLAEGGGYGRGFGPGAATIELLSSGFTGGTDFGGGGATIALNTVGFMFGNTQAYFWVIPQPPEMRGYGGSWFEAIQANVGVTDQVDQTLILLVQAIMQLTDAAQPLMQFIDTVEDSLVVRDTVSLILIGEVLGTINFTDVNEFALSQLVAVVDQLMMADESLGLINAITTVVVALLLRDTVTPVFEFVVPESLVLNEEQTFHINALVEAVSALILSSDVELSATLFTMVDDSFALVDLATAQLAAIVEVLDNLDFGIRIRVGDNVFAGYVVNVRNAAVSEYDNFPFNSFAIIGGKPFGCADDGIYLLEGDNDEGDPIQAYVRTGALFMESLTKMPAAWITLKADGSMVFKTITMDAGVKKENWYRMKQRPTGEPVETRFDPAKGVTSSYWQFELENVDGAYFELNTVKIWPVRMTRRYSGR